MKPIAWMRYYLKSRATGLLSLGILVFFTITVLYFLGIHVFNIFYILLMCLPFWVILLLRDFHRMYRQIKSLEAMRSSIIRGNQLLSKQGTPYEMELISIINAMTAEINQQEKRLRGKREELVDYYTMWGHQIKTPISAMHLILQGEGEPDVADLKQQLFRIDQYTDLVMGYLRIESMQADLHLHEYAVYPIVKRTLKKFLSSVLYQNIHIELQPFNNKVITDEKWLGFVVEQLLSNAIKYTKGGRVCLCMDRSDTLFISDTGIGIAQEDLPRIFDRGFTGYNGRINKSSSGLGLYLVKQVMDKLGHRMHITSELGKGVTVKLYLHRTDWMGGSQ